MAVVHLTQLLAYDPELLIKILPIVDQLMDVPDKIKKTPGLYALMTLEEGTREKSGSKGLIYRPSSSQGKEAIFGIYHFPPKFGEPSGVSGDLVMGVDPERVVTAEMISESDSNGMVRRDAVKEAMQHAWNGYKRYAFGFDELKPLSHRGQNNWGGMGVTLVDSLDTLWIMGMKKEFEEGRDWVRDKLSYNNAGSVSVFETTIRELGGLLAAYDLSGDKVFLTKADELGLKLLNAFDTASGNNKYYY